MYNELQEMKAVGSNFLIELIIWNTLFKFIISCFISLAAYLEKYI